MKWIMIVMPKIIIGRPTLDKFTPDLEPEIDNA